jgi:hypothetical protein
LLFLDEPTTGLDRYYYRRHTDQSILQDCRSVLHADEQQFALSAATLKHENQSFTSLYTSYDSCQCDCTCIVSVASRTFSSCFFDIFSIG